MLIIYSLDQIILGLKFHNMPTVNAGKYGFMDNSSSVSFSDLRNQSASTFNPENQPTYSSKQAVRRGYVAGAKGSEWTLRRSWWAFDVTQYASDTITNLKLFYDPTVTTTTNFPITIVKSTAQAEANSNLTTSDWNNLDFNTVYGGSVLGSTAVYWNDSNSLSSFDLNSTAVSAFTTNYLKVCIVWYSDYLNLSPSATGFENAYQNFGTIPYLSFTATSPGYGNAVTGVINSNISRVQAIPKTNISTITGV